MPYDITDFQQEVIQRSFQLPVLVDFWAEWCAPCKILGPVLERLAAQNEGQWALAKVNTEEMTDIALAYRIQSIPNVKLFSQGVVVGEFVGALPENMVKQWLEKNLPGEHDKAIETVKNLLDETRTAEAQGLLEEILTKEPENKEAKVLLAKIYSFQSPEKAIGLIRDIDDPKFNDITETIRTFIHLFEVGNKPELLPKDDSKINYLSAIKLVCSQNFDAALEAFIEIIRTNRYYDEDGSRKACIAIFKYLGEEHPTTLNFRREFSRALY